MIAICLITITAVFLFGNRVVCKVIEVAFLFTVSIILIAGLTAHFIGAV